MQQQNHSTIRLIDRTGLVLGTLTLPASLRLADLNHLRALGAVRAEVVA